MPMSNNGLNSNATNGRNSAKTTIAVTGATTATATVSISHKVEQKKPTIAGHSSKLSTTAPLNSSTHTGSSATTTTTTTTSNRNDVKSTHRRDNSSFGGGVIAGQIKRDPKLFHYGKAQCLPESNNLKEMNDINLKTRCNDFDDDANEVKTGTIELDPTTLTYYDGNLIAGTLEALIEHMVPTSVYYPERTYIFAFLLSARLFIRPHELLAQISNTWERQQQEAAAAAAAVTAATTGIDVVDEAHFSHLTVVASASPLAQRKNVDAQPATTAGIGNINAEANAAAAAAAAHKLPRTPIQKSAQNCIRLLAEWIETFPYDFRDERLMQQVRILARKCVFIDNSLGKQVSRILQMLVQRLTALEKYEEFLQALINAETSQHTISNASFNHAHAHHYSTSALASNASSVNAITATAGQTVHNVLGKSTNSTNETHSHSQSHTHSTTTATNLITNINSNNASSNCDHTTPCTDVFGIMDICGSCAQLAHQLTAIELERLSHIGPEEFVQSFVKDYQNSGQGANKSTQFSTSTSSSLSSSSSSSSSNVMTSSLHDMKKTRNLESYVEWFNRLSYLTATEIVKYPKKKQRVRIIEYWIETARECFNLGNFNSLMAIIAGLNLEPISRLKKTWSKIQSAKFSVLEHQMDPTSNFNSYRSTLKAAMWRSEGATDERERIIIPFFSLFVKDLYFLNEGCSNRLPNNHINFEKCSQLAKQIMEFNEWKKVKCPFEKLPNVIAYLQNSPILNENTLSMASFECEPPENNEEKGRYKTVKAETKQQLLQQLHEQQQQLHQQQQQH